MKLLALLIITISLLVSPVASVQSADNYPQLFTTETSAQQHCPSDTVVWLNLPSSIYHFQGQRWYGNTKTGAYVCQKEADEAGDRPTHNGQ
jgi:hypothetical protein